LRVVGLTAHVQRCFLILVRLEHRLVARERFLLDLVPLALLEELLHERHLGHLLVELFAFVLLCVVAVLTNFVVLRRWTIGLIIFAGRLLIPRRVGQIIIVGRHGSVLLHRRVQLISIRELCYTENKKDNPQQSRDGHQR